MATAIGVEACMQGKHVHFYKKAALVNELVAAKAKVHSSRRTRNQQAQWHIP
jgi:hypothetical protein